MKDTDAHLMMEALDVSRRDEAGGTAQYDPGIHGPLDRVAKLVIGKISDFPDKDIDALIYSSVEDVSSEMGGDPSAEHELNGPDVNSKVKDLIIGSLHQLAYR